MCKQSKTLVIQPKKGFTLIELLLATALGMILMITVSTMFFVTTMNSVKIEARKVIKNSGENVKRNLNFMLKNAIKLPPNETGQTCTETESSLDSLRLIAADGGITNIKLITSGSDSFIASNSARLNPENITVSNLQFSCVKNPSGEIYLSYQFQLNMGSTASQNFSGFVLLKNN